MKISSAATTINAKPAQWFHFSGCPRYQVEKPANTTRVMTSCMRDRFNQQFAAFTATLDDGQKVKWNAAIEAQLNAKRVTIYKLANGKPEAVMVRLGASDGSSTEVSGPDIAEGDQVITGERSATEAK